MNVGTLGSIINLTICFAIPLMLVALGGMYSERSGVINLALEGIMIIGALASTLFLQALDAAGWGESVFTSQLGVVLAALIGRHRRYGLLPAAGFCRHQPKGRPDHRRHGSEHLRPRLLRGGGLGRAGPGYHGHCHSHLDPLDARAATHHGRREPGFSPFPL